MKSITDELFKLQDIKYKEFQSKLLPYIKKWIKSKHVYTARFGIRMLMNEYLG